MYRIAVQARDEKKTGGKPESPGKVDDSHVKPGVNPAKPQPMTIFDQNLPTFRMFATKTIALSTLPSLHKHEIDDMFVRYRNPSPPLFQGTRTTLVVPPSFATRTLDLNLETVLEDWIKETNPCDALGYPSALLVSWPVANCGLAFYKLRTKNFWVDEEIPLQLAANGENAKTVLRHSLKRRPSSNPVSPNNPRFLKLKNLWALLKGKDCLKNS
ncbi:hypothetical protein D5086_003228 [Populus alba]|uniref:Uncharacterized protein n=1 Tax=Populus alba TaxID=43335 RepID=A0ACC4D467_POPAL